MILRMWRVAGQIGAVALGLCFGCAREAFVPSPGLAAQAEDELLLKVEAQFLSDGAVMLSWTQRGLSPGSYQVEFSDDSAKTWKPAGEVDGWQSYWVAASLPGNLADAADYAYRVRALERNDEGKITRAHPWSEPVEAALSPVEQFAVVADEPGELKLSWVSNDSQPSRVRVAYSTDNGKTWIDSAEIVGGYSSSLVLDDLPDGQAYLLLLRPELAVQRDDREEIVVETGPWKMSESIYLPPLRPTDVNAIAIGETVIRVDWTDNSQGETGYFVERSRDDGKTWEAVATTPADARSQVDTPQDVTPDTELRYRVTPVDNDAVQAELCEVDFHTVSLSEFGGFVGGRIPAEQVTTEVVDGPVVQTVRVTELNSPHAYIRVGASTNWQIKDGPIRLPESHTPLLVGLQVIEQVTANGDVLYRKVTRISGTEHDRTDASGTKWYRPVWEVIEHEEPFGPAANGAWMYPTQSDKLTVEASTTGTLLNVIANLRFVR